MRRDVGMMYLTLAVVTALGLVNLIPVSVHMIVAAAATIYIGAHGSVVALQNDHHSFDANCRECVADQAAGKQPAVLQTEHMQTKDAMMFPVYGSCVLFGLYLVFRFVAREYVMFLIKSYFFVIGVLVLGHRIKVISSAFISHSTLHAIDVRVFRFKMPRMPWEAAPAANTAAAAADASSAAPAAPADGGEDVTRYDLMCYAASVAVGVCYIVFNHWALSNIFGVCFCIQGIELIGLGSYFNGCILLAGLFVYDVFWVFGTDVMVTVAKGFDAPIKLMFPQLDPALNPSMLGLGDIVIPGIFLALILRYDFSSLKPDGRAEDVKRTYFFVVLSAYVIGLATTVAVMYIFDHAQPALLYLVPACLISSAGTAIANGQFNRLWKYTEGEIGTVPSATATATATTATATATTDKHE